MEYQLAYLDHFIESRIGSSAGMTRIKCVQKIIDYRVFMILGIAVAIAGCSRGGNRLGPMATANPFATPTPTPFAPSELFPSLEAVGPAPIHNPDGTWAGFPGPSETSAIEIPPPMPMIPVAEGTLNILVLGSDTRPGFFGSRTDTIMIISLDTQNGKVRMISLPRDLYVYIPGWKVNRINTADQHGGPEVVSMTILYNLGIEVHHWARLSFNGFISAINTLGGVDIDVPRTIVDECDERQVRYPAGMNHMNGYTALCYARVRKASSDFARTVRQQQVIRAVFAKVFSIGGITKAPQLYNQFSDLVESDMNIGDILPLVPLATTVARDTSRISGYTIDLTMVTSWRVPSSGAAVLLPNRAAIQSALITIFR
jgi:LCP family protein required for cell wall assembly